MNHWYHITNELPRQGIVEVYIDNEIGEFGIPARQFLNELKQYAGRPVKLHINSPGGSLIDAFAIYDFIKLQQYDITAHISGIAASAATIVSMAADKVYMGAHSYFFIHNPFYADGRTDRNSDLDKMKADILAIYQRKTGLPLEKLTELMDAETLLTAREAFDYGFVDGITAERAVAANLNKHLDKLPGKVVASIGAATVQPDLLDKLGALTQNLKARLAGADWAALDAVELQTTHGERLTAYPQGAETGYTAGDKVLSATGLSVPDGRYKLTDGNTIQTIHSFIHHVQKTIKNMENNNTLDVRLEELIGQLTKLLAEISGKDKPAEEAKPKDAETETKDKQIENLSAELQRIKARKLDVSIAGKDPQPAGGDEQPTGGWNYISRFLQNRYR